MAPDSQERAEKQLALLKKQIAQRKEAERALRQESAVVKLLQEVAMASNEARTSEAAFQFAVDEMCAFTGWPLGHVYEVDEDTGELAPTAIWHYDDEARYRPFIEVTMDTRFSAGEGWLGKLLVTAQPECIVYAGDGDFIRIDALNKTDIQVCLALPVLIGSEVVAALEFFSPEEAEPDEDLLEVTAHIGAQLGRVVERVRAQEALRESEEHLREREALLSEAERVAQLGSWQWDIEEDRVTWSEEMYRIYGLEQDELSFEEFLARVHPDDRDYAREVVGAAYAAQEPFEFFHRIVRPDGEVRLLRARGKPIFDETGELIRMVGTGQDVTELKQTEAKLEHTRQQLAALNELGQTVTASLELEEVFRRVLAALRPLLGAEGIFILVMEGDELVFAAADEIGEGGLEGQRVPLTGGVAGEVIETGRPIWVYGDETRRRVYRHIEETTGYRPGTLLAAPLTLHGEWIGVIEAVHSEDDAFGAGDLRLLEAAAAWTVIAIGNARLYSKVHLSHQRLRHLTQKLVTAQEKERRRISRELHDHAGQALTALKMSLLTAKNMLPGELEEPREVLAEATELSGQMIEEIRLLTHNLRPPALDSMGLEGALEGLCQEFAQRTELSISWRGEESPALQDPVAISFYRCLQEALTNVVRHAEASEVDVVLEVSEEHVELTVTDDGRGFAAGEGVPTSEKGIGILGLQERFELLGGQFEIDSADGRGTRLTARVPRKPYQKGGLER